VQIASVPERREPDEGEVNYPAILAALDRLGYAGFVGCEYRPRTHRGGACLGTALWRRASSKTMTVMARACIMS
jgi:2-dehydrotetronate isomerase